jgi:tRNA-guanine family transglycosylase
MTNNKKRYKGLSKHAKDLRPIDETCPCPTCSDGTSRAILHHTITHETAAAHGKPPQNIDDLAQSKDFNAALTLHNITFQAQVMGCARSAIMNGTFPGYLRSFFAGYFGDAGYPEWCVNALHSVGVDLLEGSNVKVVPGYGAKWEYAAS